MVSSININLKSHRGSLFNYNNSLNLTLYVNKKIPKLPQFPKLHPKSLPFESNSKSNVH
jgi:hypothetical protein